MNTLFILLELSGSRVDLVRLRRSLPPQTPDGYSMLDLKNAANAVGCRCQGIALHRGEGYLDRPAIAFIGSRSNGHFIVVRPVNGTGSTRVQVLDPPYPPLLVDYDKLTSDPHWTGRLLVCETTYEVFLPYVGLISISLLILLPLSVRSLRGRIFGRVRCSGQASVRERDGGHFPCGEDREGGPSQG